MLDKHSTMKTGQGGRGEAGYGSPQALPVWYTFLRNICKHVRRHRTSSNSVSKKAKRGGGTINKRGRGRDGAKTREKPNQE